MWKKCQINVLANYMYIWIFRWSKSVVLEGRSEADPKQRTIPAAEGQDFASNPKKSKKNWVEFGQNETISGQITNCSKINKLALLTLRAINLKYTCNPPKHFFSQFSEYFKSILFNNANSKNCIFVDYVVLSPKKHPQKYHHIRLPEPHEDGIIIQN